MGLGPSEFKSKNDVIVELNNKHWDSFVEHNPEVWEKDIQCSITCYEITHNPQTIIWVGTQLSFHFHTSLNFVI